MNRVHKYTFFLLLITILFIFSSMAGMRLILQTRERQLLTESGSRLVESPVRAWPVLESGAENEMENSTDSEKNLLTAEQMEDAVRSWNTRSGEIMHNPVEGQISMEEAIINAEQWLKKMDVLGTDSYAVKATLSVGQTETDEIQMEPYYSFWTIRFSGAGIQAELYLNAVVGRVWGAEITLYDDLSGKMTYENLALFVEQAGLKAKGPESAIIDAEGTLMKIAVENSSFYAQAHIFRWSENVSKYYYFSQTDKSEMVIAHEYALITYQLLLK